MKTTCYRCGKDCSEVGRLTKLSYAGAKGGSYSKMTKRYCVSCKNELKKELYGRKH